MCYAFAATAEADRETMSEKVDRSMATTMDSPASRVEDAGSLGSKKRAASTSLEHSPVKAVKSTEGDEGWKEGSVATVGTARKGKGEKQETIEEIKKERDDVKKRARERVKELRDEKRDTEEERDDLRGQNASLEVTIEELENRLKASTSVEASKKVAKRVEDDIKKKYDKKTAELTNSHEAKFKRMRANFQSKVDELKEEAASAKQEAKDVQAEFKQKEKDLKKDYVELKKQLKIEQQEEIKKYKPQNNEELKEKKDAIKSYEKRIKALEHQIAEHGEEVGELQARIAKDDKFKKKAFERIKADEEKLKNEKSFALSIGQEYAAKRAELQGKLEAEGRRWEKMRDCCEEAGSKLVAQQRSNFVLREANEGLVKRCQELRAERDGRASGKGGQREMAVGVAVGTQTEAKTEVKRGAAEEGVVDNEGRSEGEGTPAISAAKAVGGGQQTPEELSQSAVSPEKISTPPTADDSNARDEDQDPIDIMRSSEKDVSQLNTTSPEHETVDTPMTQPIPSIDDDAQLEPSAALNDCSKDVEAGARGGLDASMDAADTKTNGGGGSGGWGVGGATGQGEGLGFEDSESGVQVGYAGASVRGLDMDIEMEGAME